MIFNTGSNNNSKPSYEINGGVYIPDSIASIPGLGYGFVKTGKVLPALRSVFYNADASYNSDTIWLYSQSEKAFIKYDSNFNELMRRSVTDYAKFNLNGNLLVTSNTTVLNLDTNKTTTVNVSGFSVIGADANYIYVGKNGSFRRYNYSGTLVTEKTFSTLNFFDGYFVGYQLISASTSGAYQSCYLPINFSSNVATASYNNSISAPAYYMADRYCTYVYEITQGLPNAEIPAKYNNIILRQNGQYIYNRYSEHGKSSYSGAYVHKDYLNNTTSTAVEDITTQEGYGTLRIKTAPIFFNGRVYIQDVNTNEMLKLADYNFLCCIKES